MIKPHVESGFAFRSAACLLVSLLAGGAFAQGPAPAGEPPADEAKPAPSTQPRADAQSMRGMQGMQGMQMTCCPPSAMSKMVDKPGGMAMMWVCMALVAALLSSIIAVLIALALFLVRRSRVGAVAIR